MMMEDLVMMLMRMVFVMMRTTVKEHMTIAEYVTEMEVLVDVMEI